MPGRFPVEYLHDPAIAKPIEQIYADIDAFTYEVFEHDAGRRNALDFSVVLPPVLYEGRFVKGLFYSNGVDYVRRCFPSLAYLFNGLAYSMWSSYPWAERADAYLVCYANPPREAWYRKAHPDKESLPLIPLQDADYTHEYRFAPRPVADKDIDVLCVSRLVREKNLPMIARALRAYRLKYPGSPIRMTLITGGANGWAPEKLSAHSREQLAAVERELGCVADYLDVVGHVEHWSAMPAYYARSRVLVLGSLMEGKNRCINEAMSCNVPVICFREHNRFARQGHPVFPDGGGLYADYDPESLADAIFTLLDNPGAFSPRLAYLRSNGRSKFLDACIDALPYYADALPNHAPGRRAHNLWLDVAVQHNYRIGLHDFLYNNTLGVTHASGIVDIGRLVNYYNERFDC